MEEKKLQDEESEALAGLVLHVFNSEVHGVSAVAAPKGQPGAQHGAQGRDCNAQNSERHPTSCCAEVTELNPLRHSLTYLQ